MANFNLEEMKVFPTSEIPPPNSKNPQVLLADVKLSDSMETFLADCKPGTAEAYRPSMKYLSLFLRDYRFNGVLVGDIDQALDLISADQARAVRNKQFIARAIVKDYRKFLEKQVMAPKGVLAKVGALQSIGKYYEVTISTKYSQMPAPIVQTKSYAWTKETFGQFMGFMETPMYRALTSCLYQSGLGIGDALALPFKVIQEDFEAGTIPICLDLIRHKTSVEHVTFFSTESVNLLKAYFEAEGTPKLEGLIFPVKDRSVEGYFSLRSHRLLGDYGARNPSGPHSLRKFYRKSVVNAGCPESYAEYWEGHNLKADLRKIYTSMSPAEWREQYRKYMPALSFEIIEPTNKKGVKAK
jgi:integrase